MAGHWVLVGLMGAGKSTIGARLAERTGRDFIDNDAQLFAMTGRTAAELQAEHGRRELHRLERAALASALERDEPAVIAGAASVVDDPETRARLRERATVVWLDTDVDELAARVTRQTHRPLAADPRPQLEEQHRVRAAALAGVADIVVSANGSPDETVDALLERLLSKS
jgi:shikimate kinase